MRKRTVKILKGIAVIVVILGLIYAVAVAVSSAKLRRVYADLEKAGRPMKAAAVIPPKVPDAENAALLYESAGLLLKAQPAPNGNLLEYAGGLSKTFIKESLSPEKLAELQPLIEQDVVTRALWMVEQGTLRRSCRFDRDYTSGINILLPDVSVLRGLSCILGAKACLDARAGRLDDAWDMAQIQLKLADAMLNEPLLVSQLVRVVLIRLACRTIWELCEIAPPNEQQCQSLRDLFAGLDDVGPLVRSIDGERLLVGEWAFNLPRNELHKLNAENGQPEDIPGIIRQLFIFRIRFRPLFLADRAAYMRFMHESIDFLKRPYAGGAYGAEFVFRRTFSKRPYAREAYDMEKKLAETHHLMTRMLLPAISRVKVIQCEMLAELRIVRAGLALLHYKQSRNTFPDTLETLKLNDTDDPFSQEPLHYKLQGEGFVLYSVGPDRKDNSGSPRQKNQEEDWDIVWQYPNKS